MKTKLFCLLVLSCLQAVSAINAMQRNQPTSVRPTGCLGLNPAYTAAVEARKQQQQQPKPSTQPAQADSEHGYFAECRAQRRQRALEANPETITSEIQKLAQNFHDAMQRKDSPTAKRIYEAICNYDTCGVEAAESIRIGLLFAGENL